METRGVILQTKFPIGTGVVVWGGDKSKSEGASMRAIRVVCVLFSPVKLFKVRTGGSRSTGQPVEKFHGARVTV